MIERLLINANIRTLDPAHPRATALALYRERIVAVGDDSLRDLAGPDTAIDDLEGRTVLPGLTDAHIHWSWTARGMQDVDLFNTSDRAEAVRRVGARAEVTPPGQWITGQGWAQADWPDRAFPTAADLDAVTPNNPVYLSARSGHAAWVNSAALRLAGITAATPDPSGGAIQRDAAGAPTGVLLEDPAMMLVHHLVPVPSPEQLADWMLVAQEQAWQVGLTGLHDFDDPDCMAALQVMRERGQLGLRVVKHINRDWVAHAHALGLRAGFGDDWIRIGALKLFADGALGPRTGLMFAPYEGEPENTGIAVTDKEEMAELVLRATAAGLPSAIHAIGDKAVHDVLDVFALARQEEARLGIARPARRHRIEHVQIIHPDDIPRLAELSVVASMQPIHATSDYPMADRYWGRRARWSYNWRVQIEAGAMLAFGSDSPVETFDPRQGVYAALTRRRADGSPGPDGWYPEGRLVLDEALRAYTFGPAYAAGLEDRLGRLAPGYLADLIVLDRDWYTVPPEEILQTAVVGTMVGGAWKRRAFG